jgi:hypothetical protein
MGDFQTLGKEPKTNKMKYPQMCHFCTSCVHGHEDEDLSPCEEFPDGHND